jgi:manganese-dependent ADP-ribose/CDP-alcohol diphosphatase
MRRSMRAGLVLGSMAAAILFFLAVRWTDHRGGGREGGFTFGLVADVQYADQEQSGARYYRASLGKLEACVADLNLARPDFVIQLGDLIDGYPKDQARSARELEEVLIRFKGLDAPLFHVLGNHCLHAGREVVSEQLGHDRFYYDFVPPAAPGWRFVVLDGNVAGYGVLGEEQRDWLRRTLVRAASNGERVICCCHFPAVETAPQAHHLADEAAVLEILAETGVTVAWLAGHDHRGGYVQTGGVHHLTLKGMLETADTTAWALVTVRDDTLRVDGFGREPDRLLPLRK